MMHVYDIPIAEVTPYAANPRKIPARAVEDVAASIERFGWRQPLVVDDDKVIVAGHVRYEAALKLGLDTVPCVAADDLSEDDIRAYRIADNRVAEHTGWNIDKLAAEALGLDVPGFTPEELEALKVAASTKDVDEPDGDTGGGASDEESDGAGEEVEWAPVTVNVRADRVDEARPKLEELARSFD